MTSAFEDPALGKGGREIPRTRVITCSLQCTSLVGLTSFKFSILEGRPKKKLEWRL